MCFNYALFKKLLTQCCDELDEYLVLPEQSPHLHIEKEGKNYIVTFNGETMQFLITDTLLLPIANSTVEEFAHYLLQRLLSLKADFERYQISAISISVSSGPGQSGSCEWTASSN